MQKMQIRKKINLKFQDTTFWYMSLRSLINIYPFLHTYTQNIIIIFVLFHLKFFHMKMDFSTTIILPFNNIRYSSMINFNLHFINKVHVDGKVLSHIVLAIYILECIMSKCKVFSCFPVYKTELVIYNSNISNVWKAIWFLADINKSKLNEYIHESTFCQLVRTSYFSSLFRCYSEDLSAILFWFFGSFCINYVVFNDKSYFFRSFEIWI